MTLRLIHFIVLFAADLPNHAIEIEIEFHGSGPREVKHTPQRRVFRVVKARHPKKKGNVIFFFNY